MDDMADDSLLLDKLDPEREHRGTIRDCACDECRSRRTAWSVASRQRRVAAGRPRARSEGERVRNSEAAKRRQEGIHDLLWSAKEQPCADCGVQYAPWVMQFDHVRGEKLFNISQWRHDKGGRGATDIARLLDEIAKCEVVCANCHMDRTYRRSHE